MMGDSEAKVCKFNARLICDEPNEDLYRFVGTIKPADQSINLLSLNADQMMLRGSSLRNTAFIYGLVVYTGHQTKIMMNSTKAKIKLSKIEKMTNKMIIMVFCLELILCFIAGLYASIWLS